MKKEQAEEKTLVCLMNPPVVELNKMGLSNGNYEYGLTDDFLGMKPTSARGLKAKRKMFACMGLISSALVISNVVTALLCKFVTKPSHTTTVVLACPSKWVGYEGKCYYFSESEGTWDSSQSNCSASGASLAAIEDQKEMV
ncbi:C-type lectin domain family 2 member B-like isoform X2 [Anolis sagrei]|uniref:C-type lectin domain family 2 member B-like isoform X2 n=1 Tax=Anolis sagrei TaxID=38937 RepID=UPI003520C933